MSRRAVAVTAGAVALYALFAGSIAVRTPLWNDELYTWYFARLPTFGDVWDELSTGVEQLPPFYYVLERSSLWLFGDNDLALRLPSLLGLLLAGICLFLVVARRTSAWYGAVAVLVPAGTAAFRYAWEARPYALVVGFAALAVLAHQARADGVRPRLAVAALAFALATATAVHYYAVLLVIPIAAAELVRWWRSRTLDWPVLVALASPVVPLLLATPLIVEARKYSGAFWAEFDLSSAPEFYVFLLRAEIFLPSRIPDWLGIGFAAVVLVGASALLVRRPRAAQSEVAAGVALSLLPLAGVLVGELTGAYVERYVLAAVLGPALLIPLALHRIAGGARTPAVIASVVLAAWFVVLFQYWYRQVTLEHEYRERLVSFLEQELPAGGPRVAVVHHHDFLELSSYAPPAIARRLFRLSDPARAQRLTGTRSSEDGLVVLSNFAPLNLVPYARQRSPFLLLRTGPRSDGNWILTALEEDGARLRVVAEHDAEDFVLVRVEPR